jgi:hypothetical protein
MKLRSKIALVALAIAMLPCLADNAQGCSCVGPQPPCQAYGAASAVFVGVVTQISKTSMKLGEGETARAYPQRLIRFSLEQAFRGVEGKEAEIVTGSGGGDCGFEFKQGEHYIVYAHRNPSDDKLVTGICSRTRLLAEATEDLEYIRGLSKAQPGGRIYGTILQYARNLKQGNSEQAGPVAGVKVIIENPDQQLEVWTDKKGYYQIGGLKPGTYAVRPAFSEHLTPDEPRYVEVADRGCAQVDFQTTLDGRIGGKIVDDEGRAVPELRVDLALVDAADDARPLDSTAWTQTDKDGRYEFKSIPPGRYFVGVNLHPPVFVEIPYPRIYFPGVSDKGLAKIIAVGDGTKLNDYDLKLPPALVARTIEGVVVWPDGSPAIRGSVALYDARYPQLSSVFVSYANEQGEFSLKCYDGRDYLVRASITLDDGKQMHAEPIEVKASELVEAIKIIITEPNGSCERCRSWKPKQSS